MSFPPSFAARPPRSGARRKRSPLTITLVVLGAIVVVLLIMSQVWTEVLWYRQIKFVDVFTTTWLTRAALFVGAGAIMALAVWLSMRIAYRSRPVYAPVTAAQQALDQTRAALEPMRRAAMIAIPVVVGLFAGLAAASNWQAVLLWLKRKPFGTSDPQFGLDAGFYVFSLPLIRAAVSFLMSVVVVSMIAAIVVQYLYGGVRTGGKSRIRMTKQARAQIGIMAGLLSLLVAANYFLDRYSLLVGSGQKFDGANFTDANAVMPAKLILASIALIVAILFFVTAFVGDWKLPVLGVVLMVASALVVGWLYPLLINNFEVTPNAQEKESEYIQRNIDATRYAYGIDDVDVQEYSAVSTATKGALREDAVTTASIRLLDPAVVAPAFRQLQQNKQYYNFLAPLSVDRYSVDGSLRDTVVAVRELNLNGVAASSRSWINDHTVYTHGYGVVAAYGNTVSESGQPAFYEGGIPPSGALTDENAPDGYEPRVYFGQNSPDYSIVGAPEGSGGWELDYPDDQADLGQKNTTYTGSGGPSIGNLWNKVLYAMKFGSTDILFSSRVTPDSQILYDRDPHQRVEKVAPYLTLDSRAYPAVVDGRIVWVIDAYTTTNNYPYSQHLALRDVTSDSLNAVQQATLTPVPSEMINYMRNSVKAVVDAYDGSVKLYAWDDTDPMLQAWSAVYGNTITPMSKISSQLMSHLRYPEDMFKVQRDLLTRYHVTDAGSFYSGQGFWSVPNDPRIDTSKQLPEKQPPYYMTLEMPGQKNPSFSLTSTFIPTGTGTNVRDILTGFLAVNAEPGNTAGKPDADYGRLRLLQLPQSPTVNGPGQVQNMFNSDPAVQTELNLLKQGDSELVRGNLLTLPVGGGMLYVQPVYVQASSGAQFPSMRKVLVAFGNQIGYADTLNGALDMVFKGDSGARAGDWTRPQDEPIVNPDETGGGGSTPSTATPSPTSAPTQSAEPTPTASSSPTAAPTDAQGELSQALSDAEKAMDDSEAAMKAGDWEAYGKAQDALQDALNRAMAAKQALGY